MGRKKSGNFDQAQYNKQYAKDNFTRVSVVLSRKYDQDLIEHLEKQKSKSEYIKGLIREKLNNAEGS